MAITVKEFESVTPYCVACKAPSQPFRYIGNVYQRHFMAAVCETCNGYVEWSGTNADMEVLTPALLQEKLGDYAQKSKVAWLQRKKPRRLK